MHRRWVAILIAAVTVALIAPILLLAVGGLDGPRSLVATPSAAPGDLPSADVDPIDVSAWWRIGWQPMGDPAAPDWSVVTIGLVDGTILDEIELDGSAMMEGTGAPFVRGPRDGQIVYATQLAGVTELHVVNTTERTDEVLFQTRATIMDAVLVGDGTVVYAADQGVAGIWRMPLDGTAQPVRIAAPPEIAMPGIDAILAAPVTELPLGVSLRVNDGGRLAALICKAADCVLRVIDLATGIEISHLDLEPASRTMTSFVGDTAVLDGHTAIDVVTGHALPDVEPNPDVSLHGADLGVELPAGWRLETDRVDAANAMAFAVRLVAVGPAGERVRLDVLGEVSTQG